MGQASPPQPAQDPSATPRIARWPPFSLPWRQLLPRQAPRLGANYSQPCHVAASSNWLLVVWELPGSLHSGARAGTGQVRGRWGGGVCGRETEGQRQRGGGRMTPSPSSVPRGLERRGVLRRAGGSAGLRSPACPVLPGCSPRPTWPESRTRGLCLLPPAGRREACSSQQAGQGSGRPLGTMTPVTTPTSQSGLGC